MSTEIPNNTEFERQDIKDENILESEEITREMAENAAKELDINLDELLEAHKRFLEEGSPTYFIPY